MAKKKKFKKIVKWELFKGIELVWVSISLGTIFGFLFGLTKEWGFLIVPLYIIALICLVDGKPRRKVYWEEVK